MWKMPATRNFGGSHQDWQFIPGKKVHYIGNQEEVQNGSSWSARSSHFVVEPLLPTRRLFKQTCLRLLLWRVKCERCLQHVILEDLIKTGNLFPERKYIILGIRKKSNGSSWSARSSHFVVEPLLPTRSLFKQTCLRLLLWWVKCERCLQHVILEDLIKTGNLFPERKYIILGIRKKSKMDQVGQLGVPTSWLSPYCQQEVYSSRLFEIIVVMGEMWKMPATRNFEDLIKTGNLFPERKYIILGIRKKSKMDQVGQLGVPTSWLSPYCQQEVYSSRPVWDYCCDGWNVKDACNT